MAGPRVERGDLAKIARSYGQSGKPMPDWIKADPALVAAYDQGTGKHAEDTANAGGSSAPSSSGPAGPATPPAGPATPPAGSAPRARARAARTRAPRPRPAPPERTRAQQFGAVQRLDRAVFPRSGSGDGSGLFLALVLYPIALATLRYGAAGPGLWFRAKWLNETKAQPDNLPATLANGNYQPAPDKGGTTPPPGPINNVPGMPGYHTLPGSPS